MTDNHTATDAVEPAKKKLKMDSQDAQVVEVSDGDRFDIDPQFLKLLLHTRASALPTNTPGVIFIANRTDKVSDVWKALVNHNFLSVPVLQKTGSKYYGFLDLFDIVHFVVEKFGQQKLQNTEDFWALVAQEEDFQAKLVKDVMQYPVSRRNPFHPIEQSFSLLSAIELLAKVRGLHRVPVCDPERKLVGLVTQSQVVDFLKKNMGRIGPKVNKKVMEIVQSFKPITVKEADTALDAFKLMNTEGVSGVAVVNEENKIVGTLSIRDLKVLGGGYSFILETLSESKEFHYSSSTRVSTKKWPTTNTRHHQR